MAKKVSKNISRWNVVLTNNMNVTILHRESDLARCGRAVEALSKEAEVSASILSWQEAPSVDHYNKVYQFGDEYIVLKSYDNAHSISPLGKLFKPTDYIVIDELARTIFNTKDFSVKKNVSMNRIVLFDSFRPNGLVR